MRDYPSLILDTWICIFTWSQQQSDQPDREHNGDLKSDHFTILTFDYYKAIIVKLDKNRITALFKVETDIIATIVASRVR